MYSKQDQLERSLRELEALDEQLKAFTTAASSVLAPILTDWLNVKLAMLQQAITHLKAGMDQT